MVQPQIIIYALDTKRRSGSPVEVYINKKLQGIVHTGNHTTYSIKPGKLTIYVVIKEGMVPFHSDEIVIDSVQENEKITFYCGTHFSISDGVQAGIDNAIGSSVGVVGKTVMAVASPPDYSGKKNVIFRRLADGQNIETILEYAYQLKRKASLTIAAIGGGLGALFLLMGLYSLTTQSMSPDTALIGVVFAIPCFAFAYWGYRGIYQTN